MSIELLNMNMGVSKVGILYVVEHWRAGKLLSVDRMHNIFPTEALNHIIDVVLNSATQQSSWYVGIYETNTTPTLSTTYATPGWTETTSYDESARPTYTSITASGGSTNNTASPASFTMNNTASKSIYGAFITNVSTKGDTANANGVVLSAALFSSAKSVENTDVLKVKGTLTLTSS